MSANHKYEDNKTLRHKCTQISNEIMDALERNFDPIDSMLDMYDRAEDKELFMASMAFTLTFLQTRWKTAENKALK